MPALCRLKCLLAILPLSLQSSPRKQPLAKPAVSICGLLLPGLSVPMLEDAHHAQARFHEALVPVS